MTLDKDFNLRLYGADAAEWIRRWDANELVWSIEMGGFGPGYEQTIQILTAETVRYYLNAQTPHDSFDDQSKYDIMRQGRDSDPVLSKIIAQLQPSGAQLGAACNLASFIYRQGPAHVLTDTYMKDRQIQIRKQFPNIY